MSNYVFCETNCQEASRKRECENASDPTPKRLRGDGQIGEGQPQHPEENDDEPCTAAAFNTSLKKVELKPRKNQRHDMSFFLREKTIKLSLATFQRI